MRHPPDEATSSRPRAQELVPSVAAGTMLDHQTAVARDDSDRSFLSTFMIRQNHSGDYANGTREA